MIFFVFIDQLVELKCWTTNAPCASIAYSTSVVWIL